MDDTEKSKELIQYGSDILADSTGIVAGAGIGTMIGGPPGTVIGAIAGTILSKTIIAVFSDFYDRSLSDRERYKTAIGAYIAAKKIEVRLNAGELVRDDGFFPMSKRCVLMQKRFWKAHC